MVRIVKMLFSMFMAEDMYPVLVMTTEDLFLNLQKIAVLLLFNLSID